MSTGFQLNLSSAYLYTANRERVTLYGKSGALVGTVVDAKRLGAGVRERANTRGDYLQTGVDFRLPEGNTPGGEVLPGMSIIDAESVAYTIISVGAPGTYGTCWRCTCRRIRIMGFYNTVDYYRAVSTVDEFADRISLTTSRPPVVSGMAARIQPTTAEILDQFGKRGTLAHFICYVLPDIDLAFGDVLIDTANGNKRYKVASWRSKQNLADALEILVEVLP